MRGCRNDDNTVGGIACDVEADEIERKLVNVSQVRENFATARWRFACTKTIKLYFLSYFAHFLTFCAFLCALLPKALEL